MPENVGAEVNGSIQHSAVDSSTICDSSVNLFEDGLGVAGCLVFFCQSGEVDIW